MNNSQTVRIGTAFIFFSLFVLGLVVACKSGPPNKEPSSKVKHYNKKYHCCRYHCRFNKQHWCEDDWYYYYMLDEELYEENKMKTLNISAPNNATIKATVKHNNEVIYSEEI